MNVLVAAGRRLWPCRALFAQTQLLNQDAVAVAVARLQIVEQLAPAGNHAQQPAPGMVVFDIDFEVISEAVDTRRQKCDLYLRRASVTPDPLMVGDDLGLLLKRNCQ